MLRGITIFGCLSLLVVLLAACGGGGEEESSFAPRPVPSEYQGLSMGELKAQAKDLMYEDLIKGGGQDWRSDPTVEENLMKHEGELVWFEGLIDTVFESTEPDTYQLWLCGVPEPGQERAGITCVEPVFLLYSLDRGPKLEKGSGVQIAGIVVGSYKRAVSTGGGGNVFRILTPMVSVIKAELR